MKTLLTALLVVAAFSAAPVLVGFAAEPHSPYAMQAITRALDLTPQEQQQAEPIVRNALGQLRSLHRQTRDAALGALGADHRTQVEQIAAQTRAQLRALRPPAPPSPGQRAASRHYMAPVFQRGAQQIDALLTPQESQAVLSQRQQTVDLARTIVDSAILRLRPILTSDQRQRLDAWSAKLETREQRRRQVDAGRFLLMAAMQGGARVH